MNNEDQHRSKSSSTRVINSLLAADREKLAKPAVPKKTPAEGRITSGEGSKAPVAGARPDAPSKGGSQLTQLKNLLVGVKGKMLDKKKPATGGTSTTQLSHSRTRGSQLQASSSTSKIKNTGENSRVSQKSLDKRVIKPSRPDTSKSITSKREDLNSSLNGNSTNSKRSSKPGLISTVFKKGTTTSGNLSSKLSTNKSLTKVTQSSARSQSRGGNLSTLKNLGLGKDSRSLLNGGENSGLKDHNIHKHTDNTDLRRRGGDIIKTRTEEADTESSAHHHGAQLEHVQQLQRVQQQLQEGKQTRTEPTVNAQAPAQAAPVEPKRPVEPAAPKVNSFVTQVRPGQMFSDSSSRQVDLDKEIERALTPRMSDRVHQDPSSVAVNGQVVLPINHPAQLAGPADGTGDKWKQYYVRELLESLKSSDDQNPRVKAFREHLFQSAQSVLFLQNVERIDDNLLIEKKIYMPPNIQKKKTLILDLDETLIHCNDSAETPSDHKIKIKFANGDEVETGINVRPHALEFLKQMSQLFEVMIFTASHSCYANVVLNILDPNNEYITYRLFRDQCLQTNEGIFIKDLRIVANRTLDNVLIVDNATYSFGFQLENGIPILPYYEGQNDKELLYLMEYLKKIAHEPDVRPFNKSFFMYEVISAYCNEFERLVDVMLALHLQ